MRSLLSSGAVGSRLRLSLLSRSPLHNPSPPSLHAWNEDWPQADRGSEPRSGTIYLSTASSLSAHLLKQRLGVFQVGGVEAFGEPAVDGSEETVRGSVVAALPQHSCETHRRP